MFLLYSHRVKTLLSLGLVVAIIMVEVAKLLLIATLVEAVQLLIILLVPFTTLVLNRTVKHSFQFSGVISYINSLSSFAESGKSSYKKENGSSAYASSLSSVPAVSGNNRSRVSSGYRSVLLVLLENHIFLMNF